jgi:hypothetical protein
MEGNYTGTVTYGDFTLLPSADEPGDLRVEGGETILSGVVKITSTEPSTLQVAGGIEIAQDIIVHGNMAIAGTTVMENDAPTIFRNTTDSISPTTGCIIVHGGVGIVKTTYTAGRIFVNNTTQSISKATGAMVVQGGMGIAHNLFLGENLSVSGDAIFSGQLNISGPITSSNTTSSTSTETGSMILSGGVGIGENIFIGGNANVVGNLTVIGSIISSTGATVDLDVLENVTTNTDGSINFGTISSTGPQTGALVVPGGIGIGENIFVGGNANILGNLTVTGSIKSSSGATVDLDVLENVTANTDGSINFGTISSTGPQTGALVVPGGIGIGENLFVGGNAHVLGSLTVTGSIKSSSGGTIDIAGGINMNSSRIQNLATPQVPTDAVNKGYTDSLIPIAGTGLTKTGTTLSINTIQSQIVALGTLTSLSVTGSLSMNNSRIQNLATPQDPTDAVNKEYSDSLIPIAGTGLTKTGTTFSVNTVQSQITHIGTLTSLSVTGSLNMNSSRIQDLGTPQAAMDAVNKSYTDSLIPIAGTGLTKTGTTFSVNTIQSGITQVGELTGLFISGNLSVSTGSLDMNIGKIVNLGDPQVASDAVNKGYTDSIIATAGTGLTKTGTTFSVNTIQSGITQVGELTGLSISGNFLVNNGSLNMNTGTIVNLGDPQLETDAVNKRYTDSVIPIAGTGLTKTGTTFAVNTIQSQIVAIGTLTGLSISGNLSVSNGLLNMNTGTIQNLATPQLSSDAVNKSYTDSLIPIAGTGLTKTGITFSVNTIQSGIVQVGTLTGLSISGNLSVSTGTLNMNLGKIVCLGDPQLSTDAVNKGYTDSLIASAGTGLTKTGTVFSVNGAQSQITQIGTLVDLCVAGIVKGDTFSSFTTNGKITITPEVIFNRPFTLVKITGPGQAPPAGVSIYGEAIDGKLILHGSNGRKDVLSDSLKTPGDLISYSSDLLSSKVLTGPVTDGTVLTADSSSTFGLSWMGFSYYDPELDTQRGKFVSALTLAEQTLTSTDSTLIISTEYWFDRGVYEMSVAGDSLLIKEPGVYFISLRLTAYNSKYVGTSSVKWTPYKKLPTETEYTLSPIAPGYTTHTSGSGHASTTITSISLVPPGGLYVRTMVKQISGTSILKTYGAGCYLTVTSVPNQYYFLGEDATWYSLSTGTWTTLPITNICFNGKHNAPGVQPFNLNAGFNGVMTNMSNIYLFSVKMLLQKTSGTDLTSCSMQLVNESNVPFPGVSTGTPYMTATPVITDEETGTISLLWQGNINMVANVTQVKCQVLITVGSNCRAQLKEFIVHGVSIAEYPNLIEFRGYSNTGTTALDATWRDIPINNIPVPNVGIMSILNSAEITVNNTGYYYISGVIQMDNPSNIGTRQIHGRIAIWQRDVWMTLPGSYNIGMSGRKRGNTIIVHAQLQAGTKIKLQIRTDGTTTDNIVLGPSSLSASAPENVLTPVSTFITFGTYYMWVMSLDAVPMTFEWSERLRLTTKFLPAGIYMVEVTGTVSIVDYRYDGFLRFTQLHPNGTYRTLFTHTCTVPRTGDYVVFRKMNITFSKGISHLLLEQSTSAAGTEMYATNFLINMYRVM